MLKKYLFFLIIILNVSILKSQNALFEQENSVTFSKDTVCVRYQFYPKDTLVYQIISYDSVSVNYEPPLLRKRKEMVMFVCDSVDIKNRYHLSRFLLEYTAKESSPEGQNVEILDHPWLMQKVSFVIDDSGKRYEYHVDDSTTAILSPGGPFTPFLFFDIGMYCNQIGSNWNVRTNIEIPETGIPFPLFNSMILYKFREPLDTLDREVNRLEFIRTGQGSYEFPQNGNIGTITSKTNEFGLIDIDKLEEIPIHLYNTKEVKVNIKYPSGKVIPGYNYYTTYFTLMKFSSPARDKILKEEAKNKN